MGGQRNLRWPRNLGGIIALRKEQLQGSAEMKLSFGSVMGITLWATAAQTQVLPSGPGCSIPVGPDDKPLLSRPSNHPLGATALAPGPPAPFPTHPIYPTPLPSPFRT